MMRRLIPLVVVVATALGPVPNAVASCDGSATSGGDYFGSEVSCDDSGGSSGAAPTVGSGDVAYYVNVHWSRDCLVRAPGPTPCGMSECLPSEDYWMLFGQHDGEWELLGETCSLEEPDPPSPATPQVTPALVARAFQRIPLPALRAITQPAEKTLINFDTIFYVDAQPLHRTLTLLGQRVELEITPSTFRWVHGDGTTTETHTAGAPYPAKDVVHRYQQAHVTVSQHVEVVWSARWSLNGGPYQDVDGTVTTVGPATPLRIAEATPALSGYGH
jgi:hypothetical protein